MRDDDGRVPRLVGLGVADVLEAFAAGLRDLAASARFGLLFGAGYALAGWLVIASVWWLHMAWLAYPLAMGFVLVAPFALVGLYAVSDLHERGVVVTWRKIMEAIRVAARRELRWMAVVAGFGFFLWIDIAAILTLSLLGFPSLDLEFLRTIFTTTHGLAFLVVGNVAGALIALAVFSISVLSYPMLYDRDVDIATAMTTSVRAVLLSPGAMLVWAMIIAVSIGLSLLSGLLGLVVVLPLTGHATWHLYRRAVVWEAGSPARAGNAEAPPEARR
jgi:uncharacterized membrane protein